MKDSFSLQGFGDDFVSFAVNAPTGCEPLPLLLVMRLFFFLFQDWGLGFRSSVSGESPGLGNNKTALFHTKFLKVVLQKSTPPQIRHIISDSYLYKKKLTNLFGN